MRQRLDTAMKAVAGVWADFPEIQRYFWIDGKPAPMGTMLKNPPLAALFKRIAAEGPDAFYTGENARILAQTVTNAPKNPVPMTEADIAGYQTKLRKPVCGKYRVYTVCGMGPASSGGVTVLEILGMVERFPLGTWGKDDPRSWHVIGEAMQLAYADRGTWLGDPDFVSVPLTGMIDPAYLKQRSARIRLNKALNDYQPGTPPGAQPRTASRPQPESGTSHFVAVDRDGDIAAWTSTVESFFGSQLIANGVILNNELTDFSFTPEKDGAPVANRVEPGKRPLSSMSPTIVYDEKGTPVFTVGAAGGKTIIMQVAKALIAHFDWGLSAQESIAHGLIYFNGEGLVLEQGTALEAMKAPLEKLGHRVSLSRMGLKANAAERLPDGRWQGAAIRAVRACRCRSEGLPPLAVEVAGRRPDGGFDQVQLPPAVEGHAGGMTDLIDPLDRVRPLHRLRRSPSPYRGGFKGFGAALEPPFSSYFSANQAVSAGFRRVRVSMRVLIAAMARSTTLRDSGVRYWVA
ncbi:gamma-glutamyltranspeptidase [Sphingobium sp. Ant17]|nr:gamma-glutamyltranspeptidase [Sphingobium sp. Ant17]